MRPANINMCSVSEVVRRMSALLESNLPVDQGVKNENYVLETVEWMRVLNAAGPSLLFVDPFSDLHSSFGLGPLT